MAIITPICSDKPRPSTRTSGKGNQWWKRDTFHMQGDGGKTACGVKADGWLFLDPRPVRELMEDPDFCKRCAALAALLA